ncbi:hypothetical protein HHI36_020779 [Cryptolaemus montrouzieri]|uniref:Uncharacterized protein n=1 Tax=Cryptolaemus montrouzieri TaxID=559131 RepID=A0ABD2NCC1_9CUCU
MDPTEIKTEHRYQLIEAERENCCFQEFEKTREGSLNLKIKTEQLEECIEIGENKNFVKEFTDESGNIWYKSYLFNIDFEEMM